MSPKRTKAILGNYRPHHKKHTLESPERLVTQAPSPGQLWAMVERERREVSQISHTRTLDYVHDSQPTQTVRKKGSFSSVRPLNFTQASTSQGVGRGGEGEEGEEGIQSRQIYDDIDDDDDYRQRRRSSISNIRPLDYTQQQQLSSRSKDGGSTSTRSGSDSSSHARPLNYTTLEKIRAERSHNKSSSISHARPLNYTQAGGAAAGVHRHNQNARRGSSFPIPPKIDHITSEGDPASSSPTTGAAGARRASSFSTVRPLNYTEVDTLPGCDQTPTENSSVSSTRPLDYTRRRDLMADQVRKRSKALAGRALDYTKRGANANSIHGHDNHAPPAAARTRRSPSISSISNARPLDFTQKSRESSDPNEVDRIQEERRSSAAASHTRALNYTLSRTPSPSEQPPPLESGGAASAAASERKTSLACKAQFLDYTRQSLVEYEDASESDW